MSIINAASASAADVQSAINSSSNGDTVIVPASSATWNSTGVTCAKGIILDFTGVTISRGTGGTTLVDVTTHATAAFRLTGGTFINTGTATGEALQIDGDFANAKFRIDNCTFTRTDGGAYMIRIFSAWGLFDHCTMSADDSSEIIHNEAWGAGNTGGWSEDVTPGSGDALYIEDSTFSKYNQGDAFFWGTSAVQSYYGARTVVRYCTLNYCQIDQHGTGGNVGARWWEIYENVFHVPAGGGNQSDYMQLRAGSGVVFNNTKTGGSNSGAGNFILYEEDSGYPALYQVGRGKDQALDPAYCWNNFTTPSSGSSNVVDGRDFYSTTQKPGYSPYTYPHPLQGGGGGGEPGTGGHGRGHKRGILRRM